MSFQLGTGANALVVTIDDGSFMTVWSRYDCSEHPDIHRPVNLTNAARNLSGQKMLALADAVPDQAG